MKVLSLINDSNRGTIPIVLALILSALSALSGDTNVVEIAALPAGGKIYTNAIITRVTPAYAVVSYQDGLVQIPLNELPSIYQTRFGYSPEKAAQFLAAQKQNQQKQWHAEALARQAAALARTGTNQPVRITAIIDETTFGGIPLCAADGHSDGLLVKNLPGSVRQFLMSYRQLQANVADCERQVNRLKAAETPPPPKTTPKPLAGRPMMMGGSPAPVRTIAPPKKTTARQSAEDRLNALSAELDEQTTNFDHYAAIMAHPTGDFFGQKPIWICTAPPAGAAK